ncbi:hypothetical protein [Trinickia sp. EG282A]|uniref:hypothetical protein n=1 Tax=Trinickia sp. EG282A TaxID=3237013 RepID=UPI0034D28795
MKKMILAIAALATSGFAFAQSPSAASAPDAGQQITQAQLAMLHQDLQQVAGELSAHQPSQDPFSFCYFKNEAYSLGSVRDGLVCEEAGLHMTTADGSLDRKRSDPLRWIPVSPKVHRGNG